MEPEIIFVVVFVISLLVVKKTRGYYEFALPGSIAMAALLLVTALGHFMFTKGMTMLLPDFVPYRETLVYITGFIEIAAAIGLCISKHRVKTGWWLIVFFIVLLPANIYGALKHIDIQHANYDGNGIGYLWIRIPLQLFFIGWVWLAAIKKPAVNSNYGSLPLTTQ